MGDLINNKLIELIRDRPCLYDPKHSDSNSFQVKEKHWAEIAKRLHLEVTFLKKRWKVIRDRYRKERNKINNDPFTEQKSLWRHYKQLSYLEPHMTPRSFTILPKFERIEPQPKFVPNEYGDFSDYMEVLESETEDELNDAIQPQTVLEHSPLIEAVKAKPNLFDPKHYNYNSRHHREIAWEQLAKDLDSTVDSVKHNWQGLCERFCREYKNTTTNRDSFPQYVSSFEYYDQLSFLIEILNRNRSSSHDSEAEQLNCNDLSQDEDNFSYQYLKEEEDLSNEANNWFKLDDRDCKIIQFVRNNPMLYNTFHQKSKDVSIRNRKWLQLSCELDQDINTVKSRWQTIQEQYSIYNSSDNNDANSRQFIEMLAFLDHNSNTYDSDTPSNVKFEIGSNESVKEYGNQKIPITPSVIVCSGQPHISSSSSSHHDSPSTTNPAPHDSSNNSHIKMFFDSIAAQVEVENLPFRHFSIIQQEVLKVVHQQISLYLEQQ